MPNSSIIRFAANFISIILIPLFAPTYLYCIIFAYFPQLVPDYTHLAQKIYAVSGIFIATTLLPFILVFVLYKRKIIASLTLEKRSDRIIPQIFSCVSYAAVVIFLGAKEGFGSILTLSMIAVAISVIGLAAITPFWKISTHACGAWGFFSILYILHPLTHAPSFALLYYGILFMTVAVCLARLYLKVHTPMQVLAGSLMGTGVAFGVFHLI
jgi:membrane-associated phospholipid phosphatase